MPMCDIYIPEGALERGAEKALVKEVSDLLVTHEMRRITDLIDDPTEIQAVHHNETYVAGEIPEAPHYKFEVTIPEGMIDDVFRDSIAADLTRAVAQAEGGKWRHVAARVWVFTYEVPDGSWGGGGRTIHIGQTADYVAPGTGEFAAQRLAAVQRDAAAATLALVESPA